MTPTKLSRRVAITALTAIAVGSFATAPAFAAKKTTKAPKAKTVKKKATKAATAPDTKAK
jgi:hypothetical protein